MDTFERRIRVAAFHFAEGVRDANRLAELAGVSARSLYRVSGEPGHRLYPVWHSELAALGYQGDMSFRVRPPGRQVDAKKREQARRRWRSLKARYPGISRRMLSSQIAAEVLDSPDAVVGWIRAFEKEEDNE